MAPCIVCENQVSRHFYAANGTMVVQLCKDHAHKFGDMVEIIPQNDTCPRCCHFGKCCKTKLPEVQP